VLLRDGGRAHLRTTDLPNELADAVRRLQRVGGNVPAPLPLHVHQHTVKHAA
jgi:hypothetical protein